MFGTFFPTKNIKVTKLDDGETVAIERTTGADPTLPVVIYCHGDHNSGFDLYAGSEQPTFGNQVVQHSIASGYKWIANQIGDTKASMSNDSAMADIDALYALAGTNKVILTGWSMGGVSSLLWVANNISKVQGWFSWAGGCSLKWIYDNQDDQGDPVHYADGGDLKNQIHTAFGGESGYLSALPTHDPLYAGSTQLATLQANKHLLHQFITTNDAMLFPSYQRRITEVLDCTSTDLEANHNFYVFPDWNDNIVTKQLDKFSGREYLPHTAGMAQFTVTIDHTKVASALTDFPAYIDLSDMPAGFWSTVTSGGGDIRTYQADGTTEIPREVVSCDTGTNTGELHIKADLSSTTDTMLKLKVDGVSTEPSASSTYGRNAVWGNGFAAVYHLNDDALIDSTGLHSNATNYNTVSSGGYLGNGRDAYNVAYSYIDLGYNAADLGIVTIGTFSLWVKYGSGGNLGSAGIFSDWSNNQGFTIRYSGGTQLTFYVYPNNDRINANGAAVTDTWQLLTGVMDTDRMYLYLNGVQIGSLALHPMGTSSETMKLATRGDKHGYTESYLDETRVSTVARSADWILTEYNNQSSPSTFYEVTA